MRELYKSQIGVFDDKFPNGFIAEQDGDLHAVACAFDHVDGSCAKYWVAHLCTFPIRGGVVIRHVFVVRKHIIAKA